MATFHLGGRRAPGTSVLVAVIALWSLLPVVWVLKMSLSPRRELYATPPTIVPRHPTLANFTAVLGDPLFRQGLLNSVLIAGATTGICLLLGAPAAYPLARLRFRFRTPTMTMFLAFAFFPTVAIIAPLFKEFRALGLLDSYAGVIAVDSAFALPLTVWILTAFFQKLPRELEESAQLDGAGTLRTLVTIILPVAAPGIVTAGLLSFIAAWNEFLFANTFLFDQAHWPVTVVIPNYATFHSVNYGAQAAATIVVTVPLTAVVLIFQRRLVEGLTAGAVKG